MNKTKHFKRTALPLSAKSMVSTLLLLIAMLVPQGAWAISGNGTASSPYLIANEADLRTFQQYVENGNSGIYGKLTADITLTSAWTRIGRADRRFTGYFDGQGHTISGMNLSFTAYEHGFFGFVNNATIKNFTLTGTMTSSANGNHSHGTVVGSAAGTTVIENVTSSVNLTLNHTGFTCIGGIVGHMADNTRVTGCTYTGTINLTKDSEQVGGIVGYAQNDLYITDNVFSGTITSTGTCKYLAGIAGKTDGTIEVSGCTNIGTINGGPSYDCVAGIVGYVQYQSRALITNCYFGGSLSSTSSGTSLGMGGILGAVNDDAGTNFRGLTYCFSDGTLTATNSSSTQIGGIAGVIKSKAVSKVMNNTYLSGTASRLAAITNNSSTFDSSNKAITISVTAGTGGSVKKSYVYPTSTTATQLQVVATPNSGYHYVEWSDNGAQTHNVSLANNVSLTATFGAHTYGDWITDVAATCTSAGTHHRVCTHTGCGAREDGTIAALGHGSTGYTESYVWTGNAYNDASKDTKACIFTLTCKNCSTKVVNGALLTCIKTAHVDASCTATGSTTYQAKGSYTAANSAYNYMATKTNDYTVAALGHGTTGYTESYSWTGNAYNDASQDTKACTFTLTCKKCSTKVVNGASLTCTNTAHVDASCTATGSTTYQATGSYTAANSAYNYSATKTNVYTVAALGHSYGAGAWSWEDDGHTATCTRTCSHDANHTSSKSVTLGNGITSELTEAATCSKKGSHTYTATATVENVEYSDSKEVADIDIDPLNHNYGAGVWSWNNDGHSATCTRTCSYDANHTSSASVTLGNGIESVKLSDPTCGVQGTTRYTAMTTVEGAQYSDTKDIDDIAATGLHTFDDETDPHHTLCTVCAHSFFRYTSSTEDVVNPNNANALMGAGSKKLDFTNTYVDGQGVMEFKGTLKTIGLKAFYNCYLFTGNLTIPNSVTSIGTSAFYGCPGFTGNLTIPNSVTSIGESAFENCSGLKGNLTIPNSVTSIGASAFNSCSGFTGNLTIPNSVTSIGGYAFYGCYSFNGNLTIPNSVTSIKRSAFSGCWGLKGNLTIPNSVTSIEKSAFEGCKGFNGNLTIPNSVTSIGDYAFSGCKGLTGIEFQSVPQIGSSTFNQVNCSKTVVLSDNSCVYKGNNTGFPTVASVTAPCNLDLTGTAVENHGNITRTHSYTNNTLTASPVEDGLYAYVCDNGCGAHSDTHVIKDFNGEGNHLELTKDGEGYSAERVEIEDGKAFSTPVAFTTSNITMARTFTQSSSDAVVPATIMLPFCIEADKLATVDGDVVRGTKFYGFTSLTQNAETGKWQANMDRVTGLVEAYTPYMIVLTEGTAINFDDNKVTFAATPAENHNTTQGDWTFVGTSERKVWTDEDFANGEVYYGYAASGQSTAEAGKFVKVGVDASIKPLRSYIMKTPVAAGPKNAPTRATDVQVPSTIAVHLNELFATGIGELNVETGEFTFDGWYDLNGNRISEPVKNGISIKNNKKVIIK